MRVRRSHVAALALLALLAACSRLPVPPRLGGLARQRVWTGARAGQLLDELHGTHVAAAACAIAEYGPDGELKLWLSRFSEPAQAQRVLDVMLARMERGTTPFAAPRQEADDPGRWFTFGPGGHHVLWVSGATLYWLQGEPARLSRGLAELPRPSTGSWT